MPEPEERSGIFLVIVAHRRRYHGLPQTMKDFVEGQVRSAGFSTPSEYIRALIRDDQKRRAEEKLEALLLEGLQSGEPIEITPEYWERKRAQFVERHGKKTGTR